jgi:PAS domain S-box-containing protein
MNLDLEFTYVNPACLQLTGYTPKEWIGSRLPDHCDPENFDKMSRLMARAVAEGPDGPGIIFEAELIQKDGQPVPVEIHGRVTFDETGRPLMGQGVARDISERRQAEEDRRQQDRLLREMGGIAKIGAWAFDPATGEGTWTAEVSRIHGLDPEAETNLDLGLGFYRGASRQKIEQAVKEAVESGKPYNLELELITAKGDHKWVRTIGQPQLDHGKVVQVRGSLQDITEVAQSKLRIEHLNQVLRAIREVNQLIIHERDRDTLIREGCRLLVDNRSYSSALIVLTDGQEQPVSWATAGEAAASAELASILNQGRLPPCCKRARREKAVLLVKDREEVCGKCPIAAQCAQGQSLCASLDHDGQTFGFLAAAADTHLMIDDEERSLFSEMVGDFAYALSVMNIQAERGQLQARLIQARKMEAVGRLAGGVAHDYNNMLSVIMGYTEFALERLDQQDPMHADLSEVLTAAKRSRDITRQLLAFARQQTIAPRLLDLNETVENTLKMLRRLIGEDIDLLWQPAAALWAVNMDPTQIDQILANLCVNARDAIADVGKVTIETGKTTFDKAYCADHAGFVPGDFVLLAVSDDGCGMDKATLDKLFEPFFTTKGVGKGTGLGLATVYGIVKQNEGFVNVYSEPGKGSTFRIYLPRHMGEALADHLRGVEEIPAGHGETVLVVEDDPAVLKLAERFLTDLGYRVLPAGAPAAALQLAEAHRDTIALLITDVVMPGMNGRDLASQLHTPYPELKTLFMSGYTANVIAHRGVLDEGVNFIQKPFSKKDLASKVKAALDTAGDVQ